MQSPSGRSCTSHGQWSRQHDTACSAMSGDGIELQFSRMAHASCRTRHAAAMRTMLLTSFTCPPCKNLKPITRRRSACSVSLTRVLFTYRCGLERHALWAHFMAVHDITSVIGAVGVSLSCRYHSLLLVKGCAVYISMVSSCRNGNSCIG